VVFAELTLAHGKGNWRLFVVLCALPCFVSVILGWLYVPESVRWLVSVGRTDEALEILREAARINKLTASIPLTEGDGDHSEHLDDNNADIDDVVDYIFPSSAQLISDEDHSAEGSASYADLLKPQWRGIILRLWGAWLGFGMGYYGAIMSVTKVFDSEGPEEAEGSDFYNMTYNSSTMALTDNTTVTKVTEANDFDYSAIFISSSAELIGTTLVIALIDRVGRIPAQVFGYGAAGIAIFLLCTIASTHPSDAARSDRLELVALGFLLRALDMAATCTSWVSTAEVLPTEVRSTGHSSANAMARIGAFFSPFLVDTVSLETLGIVMLFVHWFTAAMVFGLPETKGAHMGGHGGGSGSVSGEEPENDAWQDAFNEDNRQSPPPDDEGDGIFVIDDDEDYHEQGDRAGVGEGPQIHIIPDYRERVAKSLEIS